MKSGTTVVPVGSCQQALDNVQSHCPIRNSIPPSLRRKNIRREYIKDKNKARNWTGSPFQYQTDYWDLLFWYSFIFNSRVSTVIFTKSETAMLSTGKVTKIQRYCFIWNTIEQGHQIAPSIYIMIELCFFSLHQWEIRIHLPWGKYFNIPHW